MEMMEQWVGWLVGAVWGLPLVFLLFGAGLVFTVLYGFPQLRLFKHAIDIILGRYDKEDDQGELSHFQALCTALSATVGLGNIAGVAIAIQAGGPGAAVWMIVTAFFGMCSKFHSCTLSQIYRHLGDPVLRKVLLV